MERAKCFRVGSTLIYNPKVSFLRNLLFAMNVCVAAMALWPGPAAAQKPPAPSAGRILLLPRRAAAGESATLAVLDVNGRLTPGVTVVFSTGARVTTDATGRGSFLAPPVPGTIFASIKGRRKRVALPIAEAPQGVDAPLAILTVPRFASLADRFDLMGTGFCNVADANRVTIAGRTALVLAASSLALTILPPEGTLAGPAEVTLTCENRGATSFTLTFVSLELRASPGPLAPGERRDLLVRITGSNERLLLEARNLAPEIAALAGGNPVRVASTGGRENSARFQVLGRAHGSFVISIQLVPIHTSPRS